TAETRGLIGDAELRLMKPTAIVVNVARAQILDEDALYAALAEKRIAGAALDVWYRYPTEPGPLLPSRRAFHELPNVLMTPHVSGWTDGMLEARATRIAENIRRTACGEQPENMVPSASIGETPGRACDERARQAQARPHAHGRSDEQLRVRPALVARAPRVLAARPGGRRGDHPATSELSRVRTGWPEPGDDPATRHRAGHPPSPPERPAPPPAPP